jgi:hypothetical protein
VAVGAHIAAGLQHIDEALNLILLLVKIVVQAQTGMLTGLCGNPCEQLLVNAAKLCGCHRFGSAADR